MSDLRTRIRTIDKGRVRAPGSHARLFLLQGNS